MTFVSMWMYRNWDSATVLRISCVMQIVGAWVRLFCDVGNGIFWPVLLGQIIISLA
jgi:hypothetical protein